MTSLGELMVNFGADTSSLNRQINGSIQAFTRLGREAQRLSNRLNSSDLSLNQSIRLNEQLRRTQREMDNVNNHIRQMQDQFENLHNSSTQRMARIGQSMQAFGQSMQSVGNSMRNVGMSMNQYVTRPIIMGLGYAVKANMEFQKQLSHTGAVAGATSGEMERLKEQALLLGKNTQYTALEVTRGQTELIKAGRNVNQVFSEMDDVLNLAAAGGLEIARSSEIGSNVVNMFAKQGVKMSEVADLMAGTANASAIDVNEFYNSLSYVGPMAASLNIPLSEVSSVIGVLGNNAIKGSKAGTGLRQFLVRLQPQSDKAAAAFQKLGIITKDGSNKFYDAKGKIKPLSEVIDVLRNSVSGLTDMQKQEDIKQMFGLIASPTVLSLLNSNSDALDKMSESIGKVGAAEVAEDRMNNFAGQLEFLKGSLETFAIKVGDTMTPVLRVIVKALDFVMKILLELPKPVLAAGVAFSLLVAAIGPVLIVGGTLIALLGAVVAGIGAIAGAVGTIGIPILAGLAAGISGLVVQFTTFVGIILLTINDIFPLLDTFKLLSTLIKGNVKGSLKILTEKFGMSSESANKLVNSLIEIKDKSIQIWKVISANFVPAFELAKKAIFDAVVGFDGFNQSTVDSRSNVVKLFTSIAEPVKNFLKNIYRTLDAFGLIPVEVKYANNKSIAEYIRLHSEVKRNLDSLVAVNQNYGNRTIAQNHKMHSQMLSDTKKALDNEMKFVVDQIKKKQSSQLKASQDLFSSSNTLTEKAEAEKLIKINEYQQKEVSGVKSKYEKIYQIISTATKQHRALTEAELAQKSILEQEIESKTLSMLTNSRFKQLAILTETKNLATSISRQQGLQMVVDANNAYNQTVAKAKQAKDEHIATAIMQRDQMGVLNDMQVATIIKDENEKYNITVSNARKTKDETYALAVQKSNGIIGEGDREKTEITTQSDKIKAASIQLWTDLQTDLPPIVTNIADTILDILGNYFKNKLSVIMEDISNSIKEGFRNALPSAWDDIIPANSYSANKKMNSSKVTVSQAKSQSKAYKKTKKKLSSASSIKNAFPSFASGTESAIGGLSLVGEKGPELINLPRGTQVYTAEETKKILSAGGGGGKGSGRKKGSKNKKTKLKEKGSTKKATTKKVKVKKVKPPKNPYKLASSYMKSYATGAAKNSSIVKKAILSISKSLDEGASKSLSKKVLTDVKDMDSQGLNYYFGDLSDKIKTGFKGVKTDTEKYVKKIGVMKDAIAQINRSSKLKPFKNTILKSLKWRDESGVTEYMNSLADKIKSGYDSLKSKTQEYMNTTDLFSMAEKPGQFSGVKFKKYLDSQVKQLKDWQTELNKFGKRVGTGSNLFNQIAEMGPGALGQVTALNQMKSPDLQKYLETYNIKGNISKQLAASDYARETAREKNYNDIIFNITGQTDTNAGIDKIANQIIKKLKVSGIY